MPKLQSLGLALSHLRTFAGKLWRLEAQFRGAEFRGAARLEGRPIITVHPGSRLVLGHGIGLTSALRSNPLGCFQPCVLRTLAPDSELIIADGTGMSGTVICAGKSVRIGEGTIIGSGALIIDNDFHAFDPGKGWQNEYQRNARPVDIGKHVFIGARAIILKGVTIGDHSIIGAGAVVTRSVPPRHLAAGNPASVRPLQNG